MYNCTCVPCKPRWYGLYYFYIKGWQISKFQKVEVKKAQ